jgi:hypothetical protein
MTVVVERPSLEVNGNGTKTGYAFSFSYTNAAEIKIWYTADGASTRLLVPNEYKLIPNNPPFAGATVEFLTITPALTDIIRFTRSTFISQDIDYIGTGTVSPVNVEFDFDKIVRILQELYTEWEDVQRITGGFPSPLLQAFGNFIVSNGISGWDFFPLRFDNPQATDDAKILLIDIPNKRIRYQSAPSIANPVLPQPTPGATFKLVGIKDGSYQIGAEIPIFTSTDVGKVAIWDGTKYIGVLGSGVTNPPIPVPPSAGLVLNSKADGTTEWFNDGFKRIAMSSGVVSGLRITRVNNTTVNIDPGILEVVENTTGIPDVKIVNFAGQTNVSIPTSTGFASYLYIDASGAIPIVVVQSTYENLPRGSKIYIGEIAHSSANQITAIHQDYTVVAAIPSQLREIASSFLASKITNTTLLPNSTGGASPANMQMKFAGGGIFIGYGVNIANDVLNPHVLTGVPGATPAQFRWRNALDADTPIQTTLSTSIPLISNGAGVLSPIPNNHFIQVLVWISPTGELILQFPRTSYAQRVDIPTVSDFLTRVEKSPSALRNLAPFAVLQMRQGTTFQDTANTFITPISGFSATGIAGAQGDRLPFASPADVGKPLVVSPTSSWVVGSYSLPSLPVGTPAGQSLVTTGSTTSLSLGFPTDNVARVWLSNGVIDGFKASFVTGSTLSITAGRAIFCNTNTAGELPSLSIVSYAGGTYNIAGIASRDVSYIAFNINGTLSESALPSSNVRRGNVIDLFRVEHYGNVNIENVEPIYNPLSVIPSQIKDIYDLIGRAIKNFEVTVKTPTSLKISSAMFYGYDAGANINVLIPHSFQMPAQDPLNFKFIKINGDVSALTTDFPAVPSVEGVGGALTPLPTGNVGYYAVWMYRDGRTFVEYATTSYPAASAPSISDYFLTYKRNPLLDTIAVLIGFIKWENGKDYSNGNAFIPINAPVTSGGGTLPLIPTTTFDYNRLVTVKENGAIGLGVVLPQPLSDGSDSATFANQVIAYDILGRTLTLRDFSNVLGFNHQAKSLAGSYLVGVRNGELIALTDKTDFVTPTLHNFSGAEYYPAEPIYVHTSRRGVLISLFSRNDDGGGLNTPGDFPIKIADLVTNKRMVWGSTAPAQPVGFGSPNRGINNNYYKWLPQNTTNAALYNAASNEYVVQDSNYIEQTTVSLTNEGSAISGSNISSTIDLLKTAPFDTTLSLNGSTVANDLGSGFSYAAEFRQDGSAARWFYISKRNFISISIPVGKQIKGKIRIKGVDIYSANKIQSGYDPNLGLSFFVTSSTALSPADVLFDMNLGSTPNTKLHFDVNKEFSFDSTSTNFYHDFSNTPDPNKNIVIGATFRLVEVLTTNRSWSIGSNGCEITFGIELTESRQTNLSPYSRYEYTTLAALNAATAIDGKIWEGEASPLAPDPSTGKYKVTLIYAILHPSVIKSSADYNGDYEGIFVHPLKPEDTPQVFLEDQSGTAKYTQRVQFTKRNVKSTLFEVYDIECTADQFNNWRVAIYFTNKLLEATFKTYCDTVGASVWVINSNDFRE